jgi:hypothetical protein
MLYALVAVGSFICGWFLNSCWYRTRLHDLEDRGAALASLEELHR